MQRESRNPWVACYIMRDQVSAIQDLCYKDRGLCDLLFEPGIERRGPVAGSRKGR